MAKFRILSIDGGGLRGIIPVLILQELERRTGKRFVSKNGKPLYSLQQVEEVYTKRGKEIFPDTGPLGDIFTDIKALKEPKYKPDGLSNVLKDLVGNYRLSDLLIPAVVPSYDLDNNQPCIFKSRTIAEDNALLYNMCRATSAAPTYFPAFQCTYRGMQRTCIDGGVYMNNPALAAIVEISKYKKDPFYRNALPAFPGGVENIIFDDICVLSLGTGHYTDNIVEKKVQNWGMLGWAPVIADVMMQAVNQTTCYESEEILATGNHFRLTIDIDDPKYADMADSSDACRNYLINLVQRNIFNNSALMTQWDTFIEHAELKRTASAPVVA
jgi:patatin-like phospholipase/acyl hydrolase